MATESYLIGVILSISIGINNSFGTIFQKKVINDLSLEAREKKFGRSIAKNPLWLLGLFMQMGVSTVLLMFANLFIGPAIIPGLSAIGMIVLAIGSAKLLKETLKAQEFIGIILLIAAIALLALSELEINIQAQPLLNPEFIYRVVIFTGFFAGVTLCSHFIQRVVPKYRSIFLAVQSGMMLGISGFWLSPLLVIIAEVLAGKGSWDEVILFVSACVILISTNFFSLMFMQKSFTSGEVNKLIPIQAIPVQTIPLLIYYYVYALPPAHSNSVIFSLIAVSIIIVCAFLLGNRQAEINKIQELAKTQ